MKVQKRQKEGCKLQKKTLLFLKFMITLTIKEKKGKENYEIRKI